MKQETINRRNVIKSLGGSMSVTSFIGGSNAKRTSSNRPEIGEMNDLHVEYQKTSKLLSAINKYGSDLLFELESRGILESADPWDLDISNRLSTNLVKAEETREGVALTTVLHRNGRQSSHIMLSKNTGNYKIGIYIQPEREHSYAIVKPRDTSKPKFVVDPTKSEIGTESVDCQDSTYCGSVCDKMCNPWPSPDVVGYYEVYESCYAYEDTCRCYIEGKSCSSEACYCNDYGCPGC